jgi:wobble nucleotide-excising tRNase
LASFVNGEGASNHTEVAKAIRPLLEGYLHRRFPSLIPQDRVFGQVVEWIKSKEHSHPVASVKHLVQELNEINEYAGQFHHDTDQGNDDVLVIAPTELRTYAQRALNILYKGDILNVTI